jgi:enamidase
MTDVVIRNIGRIVSGDLAHPFVDGDTLVVRDGKIAQVGSWTAVSSQGIDHIVDAGGCMVAPGLIDSHTHPVLGDFTPRQRMIDFIESCLHGGVTRMISAGEVHTPGRPKDALGTKSLAILASKAFRNIRPGGVKVLGGSVLLEPGLTEKDFEEMAAAGIKIVGEIGVSGVYKPEQAAPMTRWAQKHGMKVMIHMGGASVPGSNAIDAQIALAIRPDVAVHINGGPTAPSLPDIERLIVESDMSLEIVQCGNIAIIPGIMGLIIKHNALGRLIIGTDMPSGTGVIPLGILRTISNVSALGGLAPEQAIALATGNTARVYDLPAGRIEVGLEADVIIIDAPRGSQAQDALEALRIGDTPAVAAAFVDGEVKVFPSRNTPPPQRKVEIPWMQAGGH